MLRVFPVAVSVRRVSGFMSIMFGRSYSCRVSLRRKCVCSLNLLWGPRCLRLCIIRCVVMSSWLRLLLGLLFWILVCRRRGSLRVVLVTLVMVGCRVLTRVFGTVLRLVVVSVLRKLLISMVGVPFRLVGVLVVLMFVRLLSRIWIPCVRLLCLVCCLWGWLL